MLAGFAEFQQLQLPHAAGSGCELGLPPDSPHWLHTIQCCAPGWCLIPVCFVPSLPQLLALKHPLVVALLWLLPDPSWALASHG
ncbi:hypothetical protein EK904_013559 [Melospiza melodia maxima]|nr:hypothetical protein EK904_013559 [Melospiza melodia maxima]